MKSLFIFAAVLLACHHAALAGAEFEDKVKPATEENLFGEWRLAFQKVNPQINQTDSPFFFKNQIWSFTQDGIVRNLSSSSPVDAERAAKLLNSMARKTVFQFKNPGVLQIIRPGNSTDLIVTSSVTRDFKEPLYEGAPLLKKGDLLLAYLMPNGKPYMHRILKSENIPGIEK